LAYFTLEGFIGFLFELPVLKAIKVIWKGSQPKINVYIG